MLAGTWKPAVMCLPAAGIGGMADLEIAVEAVGQLRHVQALRGDGAGSPVDGPIGVLFRGLEEFFPCVDTGALVGAQYAFHAGDVGDGLDVLEAIAHIGQLGGGGEGAEAGEGEGIAVGTGAEHFIDADGLCSAGFVHDVDGDVVVLLEVVGEDARRDVDAASGTEGHDDVDGLVVGVFRPGIRVAADKQGTGDEQRGDDAFLHGNSILLIVWGTWAGDCPFQRADGVVPKGS